LLIDLVDLVDLILCFYHLRSTSSLIMASFRPRVEEVFRNDEAKKTLIEACILFCPWTPLTQLRTCWPKSRNVPENEMLRKANLIWPKIPPAHITNVWSKRSRTDPTFRHPRLRVSRLGNGVSANVLQDCDRFLLVLIDGDSMPVRP